MYSPNETINPSTLEQLRDYLREELRAIAREMVRTELVQLQVLYVEPAKPRDGMIVAADGTEWDPGSLGGPSLYAYFAADGGWVPL